MEEAQHPSRNKGLLQGLPKLFAINGCVTLRRRCCRVSRSASSGVPRKGSRSALGCKGKFRDDDSFVLKSWS